jgi:hypothetical protein
MSVPVELGREAAQQAAREELAKQVYREAGPGLTERFLRWLVDRAGDLLDGAAGVSPGGKVGALVVLLLLVAAVIAVRRRLGPVRRAPGGEQPLFAGTERSAAEHRAAADAHAASGEWAEAVRERLRAVVRDLEERGVLEPRPGRTADEAATEAGALLPACAGPLRAGARVFDDVWYGGRPGTRAADEELRALDQAVRSARAVPPSDDATGSGTGSPVATGRPW